MLLVARVRRTAIDRALLDRGTSVVVGVSGGPDSTALLDVLCRLASELSLRIVAAGVDHGLRSGASAELDVAATHAARLAVPFERVVLTPPDRVDHAWARAARYAALHDVASRHGATRIAVGHTLDDQAETVVARLLRGAGLRGLGAIDPARDDGVVRPLIDATRAEVRAYLAHEGLAFVDDPSNVDPRFERTRIRSTVLPTLLGEDPNLLAHLSQLADEARDADALLDALATRLLADAASGPSLALEVLRAAPKPLALRALRLSAGVDLARSHLSELSRWLTEPVEAAELRLAGGLIARLDAGRLTWTRSLGRAPDEEG
jgi:tRNA(Ile)-lysidine synthase